MNTVDVLRPGFKELTKRLNIYVVRHVFSWLRWPEENSQYFVVELLDEDLFMYAMKCGCNFNEYVLKKALIKKNTRECHFVMRVVNKHISNLFKSVSALYKTNVRKLAIKTHVLSVVKLVFNNIKLASYEKYNEFAVGVENNCDIEILRFLLTTNDPRLMYHEQTIKAAAEHPSTRPLENLKALGMLFEPNHCASIINVCETVEHIKVILCDCPETITLMINPNFQKVKYLHENGFKLFIAAFASAILCDNFDLVVYYNVHNCRWPDKAHWWKKSSHRIKKYVVEKCFFEPIAIDLEQLFYSCFENCDFDFLKSHHNTLFKKIVGVEITKECCIRGGFEAVKYMHTKYKCKITDSLILNTIQQQIPNKTCIMRFLIKNHKSSNPEICKMLARYGDSDLIKEACRSGYACDISAVSSALVFGQHDCLKFLLEFGCDWDIIGVMTCPQLNGCSDLTFDFISSNIEKNKACVNLLLQYATLY